VVKDNNPRAHRRLRGRFGIPSFNNEYSAKRLLLEEVSTHMERTLDAEFHDAIRVADEVLTALEKHSLPNWLVSNVMQSSTHLTIIEKLSSDIDSWVHAANRFGALDSLKESLAICQESTLKIDLESRFKFCKEVESMLRSIKVCVIQRHLELS